MNASISPSAWQIPVDFMITKAPLGLTGAGDLTVYDANGNLVFRIKRCSRPSPHRIKTLFDAMGNPLITVVHHNDGWQAFRGNNYEWKDLIFTVEKTLYSPFKTELEVVLLGRNQGDLKPSFRLKGNPFRRSCTIFTGDSIFAQTSLCYKLQKVIYSRRKFRLTVYPRNDPVLVMAMLVAFFWR
ncbi:protein LURP-one-related 7 [Elaeis guineensis]|uniref:Protein LURP-one-related 7 n=1 Tax=Elaeis guineensis var. tenera TaxID=51953 RepID=A0A6I9R692_ELAGV|nr:protein LURP-one-related 7 [Elaeis guineensis]